MKRVILGHLAILVAAMLFIGCADSSREATRVASAQRAESAGGESAAAPADMYDGGGAADEASFEEDSAGPLPFAAQAPAAEPAAKLESLSPAGGGGSGSSGRASSGPGSSVPSGGEKATFRSTSSPEKSVAAGLPASSAPLLRKAAAPAATDDVARSLAGLERPETAPRTPETRPAEPRKPRNDIQSGLLTAGSFDDNEHFDAYHKYLSKALQQDSRETFPRFAIGERVEIQVVDPQGRPVGGARVVVTSGERAAGGEQNAAAELLSVVTPSDGRAVFCTGLDKGAGQQGAGQQAFTVAVTPADGQQTTQTFKLGQRPWRITLADSEAALPRRLDLALVIDTTGSMADELEYLKVEIDSIAASISRMFPNVDQRYALIVYRDQGDEYVSRTFDFTRSLEDFRDHLAAQAASGGGDYPEAVQVAVEHAGKLSWRDGNTARVMFLVGDAPPHDEYLGAALDATQSLRRRGVRLFPVGGSGVGQKAQFVFRAMSFLTMGQYLFLTDHSGIGNPHTTPDVPEFQVERLDRLMIRMISSELAGKRLAPQEVIAIERGDLEPSVPPVLETNQGQGQGDNQDGQAQPAEPQAGAAGAADAGSSFSLPSLAASPLAWIALAMVVCCVFACDAIRDRRRGSD